MNEDEKYMFFKHNKIHLKADGTYTMPKASKSEDISLWKLPHNADYCVEYKQDFLDVSIAVLQNCLATAFKYSDFSTMNASFVKNNIPPPYPTYFPFKFWKIYELFMLDRTIHMDANNMNNEVRTKNLNFFKTNGV